MVNYCCVHNCGRNSRHDKQLTYFSFPKERDRQEQWLVAVGREDLLHKVTNQQLATSYRVCSRHFPSSARLRSPRSLTADAMPTQHLPGTSQTDDERSTEPEHKPIAHSNVVCDSCRSPIIGFRYKCVTCEDFDLCHSCETLDMHPQHYMLRIPRPDMLKSADTLARDWNKFFNSEGITTDKDFQTVPESESSDDEPITKYATSSVNIPESMKKKIQVEVARVLKLSKEITENKAKEMMSRRFKRPKACHSETQSPSSSKRLKTETVTDSSAVSDDGMVPEVAFSDVPNNAPDLELKLECESSDDHEISALDLELKSECKSSDDYERKASTSNAQTCEEFFSSWKNTSEADDSNINETAETSTPTDLPVMHVKLSDDLSELMIEVTSKNQKTVYNC